MLEYSLHGHGNNRAHQTPARKAQEQPSPEVPEGHQEEGKDISRVDMRTAESAPCGSVIPIKLRGTGRPRQ